MIFVSFVLFYCIYIKWWKNQCYERQQVMWASFPIHMYVPPAAYLVSSALFDSSILSSMICLFVTSTCNQRSSSVWILCQAWLAGALTVNITCLGDRANKSLIRIRPNKKNLMFRARVLKTLGRVGSVVFFKDWKLNYKDPNEKKSGIFRKKSLGSAGSDR